MPEPKTFIASYANRSDAALAAETLSADARRFGMPESPEENGEWAVYALAAIPHADVERLSRFLRARHIGEPASW